MYMRRTGVHRYRSVLSDSMIALDLLQGHPVHGLRRDAVRHGTVVPVDPAVRPEVQRRVVQLSIDVLQRQSPAATLSDDGQDRVGVPHLAYLTPLGPPSHLPPFAMWAALPPSDYYGGSVAVGLAPDRRSRFPDR